MIFKFSPEDLCPCESGRQIKCCCLRNDGSLRPRQVRTHPPLPRTGYSHKRCYAALLNDCSTRISGEHTLSHAVLKELSPTGIIEVSGLGDKAPDEYTSVRASEFVSNVLCERHNNALSPLDVIGHRFFKSFKNINADLLNKTGVPQNCSYLFNGHDIERYILKALCGDGFANKMRGEQERIKGWSPSVKWLRILYGLDEFPVGWGLYLSSTPEETIHLDEHTLGLMPVMKNGEELCGAKFKILGVELELLMITPHPQQHRYGENCRYRPNGISFSDGRAYQTIMFGWDIRGQGGTLPIEYPLLKAHRTQTQDKLQ